MLDRDLSKPKFPKLNCYCFRQKGTQTQKLVFSFFLISGTCLKIWFIYIIKICHNYVNNLYKLIKSTQCKQRYYEKKKRSLLINKQKYYMYMYFFSIIWNMLANSSFMFSQVVFPQYEEERSKFHPMACSIIENRTKVEGYSQIFCNEYKFFSSFFFHRSQFLRKKNRK